MTLIRIIFPMLVLALLVGTVFEENLLPAYWIAAVCYLIWEALHIRVHLAASLGGAIGALGCWVYIFLEWSSFETGSYRLNEFTPVAMGAVLALATLGGGISYGARRVKQHNKMATEKLPNFKIWVKIVIFIFVILHFIISVKNDHNALGPISLIQSLSYLIIGLIIAFDRTSPKYITIPMMIVGASSFPLGLLVIIPAVKTRKLSKNLPGTKDVIKPEDLTKEHSTEDKC